MNLCAGIYYQKSDANIVIYADNCYPGDEILDKLVHNGITNIVANYPDVDEKTNISMMTQDLKECITEGLSQKKWRRFNKSFDAFAEAREAARIAEKEKEKPRYSQSNISIAVVGAQGRIGATTFAGSGIVESFLKMLDPVIAATHWILTAIVILSIGRL